MRRDLPLGAGLDVLCGRLGRLDYRLDLPSRQLGSL
jgi:hypothetical protein